MIIKKLNKVGVNSKAVLIDQTILKLLGITDKIQLEVIDGKIILTPIKEDN